MVLNVAKYELCCVPDYHPRQEMTILHTVFFTFHCVKTSPIHQNYDVFSPQHPDWDCVIVPAK